MRSNLAYTKRELIDIWSKNNNYLQSSNTIVFKENKIVIAPDIHFRHVFQKNFDEGEIFNCCFAECEIPPWFCYEYERSMEFPLSPEFVNDPDWMGFALCGLFLFSMHPTAVRQSRRSKKIEMLQFYCLLRTSSSNQLFVCDGLLTTDNELVTLNQRAFIWVMFIPRTTHAHLWSQSAWAEFLLESTTPDLFAQSFGIKVVYRHNMEELTQTLVQCSAPFDSFLDSCDPRAFCNIWDNYPELFIGRRNSPLLLPSRRTSTTATQITGVEQFRRRKSSPYALCFLKPLLPPLGLCHHLLVRTSTTPHIESLCHIGL